MSINLKVPKLTELKPRIVVIGVGGAGGNAINNMIAAGISGVEFVSANTDAQALASSSAEHRIQLGVTVTEGLGAGARPEIGQAAAEEAIEEIKGHVAGAHMVFIAAGMGGGTGTGAAAVIARAARESGALTVAIVTKPFAFEGSRRMRMAEAGIEELNGSVDTLIVIPNQNLFRIANEKTTFADAFLLADQVLHSGIACITDLIIREGLINLDFADVRTVMSGMGTAMMGTGEASGERRAVQAAELAILNPLLDDISLKGARGLLVSISGDRNLTLYEVDEAASRIRQEVDPEANIIVGATFDDTLEDKLRVSIVASGLVDAAGAGHASPHRAVQHEQRRAVPAPQQAPAHHDPAPPQQGQAQWHRQVAPVSEPPQHHYGHAADQRYEPAGPSPQWSLEPAGHDGAHHADPSIWQDEARGYASGDDSAATGDDGHGHELEPADTNEVWRGPGDVVIELGPAQRARPEQPQHASREPMHPELVREPLFSPQPPVDVRRPPRRMPEVEDFPTVGQREYLSKRAQPAEPAEEPVDKRRPGLFARLTGLGNDSRRPSRPADAAEREHQTSAGPASDSHERSRQGQQRELAIDDPRLERRPRHAPGRS